MIKVSKSSATQTYSVAEGRMVDLPNNYLYINISGFKDEAEQDIIFKKIQNILEICRHGIPINDECTRCHLNKELLLDW